MDDEQNEYIVTKIEKYKKILTEESVKQIAFVLWIIAAIIAITFNPKIEDMTIDNRIFIDVKLIISIAIISECTQHLFKSILKIIKIGIKKKKLKEQLNKLNTQNNNKIKIKK